MNEDLICLKCQYMIRVEKIQYPEGDRYRGNCSYFDHDGRKSFLGPGSCGYYVKHKDNNELKENNNE